MFLQNRGGEWCHLNTLLLTKQKARPIEFKKILIYYDQRTLLISSPSPSPQQQLPPPIATNLQNKYTAEEESVNQIQNRKHKGLD